MKIYKIENKAGKTFWTMQLPLDDGNEEVVGEATLTDDLLADKKIAISEKDKNYIILELAQMVRLNNVEEKIAIAKIRPKRKARKTLK